MSANGSPTRLVAVLGYSTWIGDELHAVCAARLARAAEETTPADAVLLSGWARRRRHTPEAVLMARAWSGSAREVLLDPHARTTYGNARAVARAARRLGATEIVLVTSGWHGARAAALVRAAHRGCPGKLTVAATEDRGSLAHRVREVLCWTLVPAQVALLATHRGSR